MLPKGIKRLRHYGVLTSACKGGKLGAARQALQMPVINPRAVESARDFMMRVAKVDVMLCPRCKTERLQVIEMLAGNRRLSAPGSVLKQQSRGPPRDETQTTTEATFLHRNQCGWEELTMSDRTLTATNQMLA